MKTELPKGIFTVNEARRFLRKLFNNGEAFHPDDSAFGVIDGSTGMMLFNDDEAGQLDTLVAQMQDLESDDFDICKFLLELTFLAMRK